MKIRHNISAMNAERNSRKNRGSMMKNLEKLSSGYRINRAADDAAGLAISERMQLAISGYEQGENNISDGIGLVQTADGAMQEIHDLLNRMITLSTKAANGTYTEKERQRIQEEIDQILKEITRITNESEFNDIPLFEGEDKIITNADGSPAIGGNIPFENFELVDTKLGVHPFMTQSADFMHLQAIVNKEGSALNGQQFSLIFGDGSTSDSSLQVTFYEKATPPDPDPDPDLDPDLDPTPDPDGTPDSGAGINDDPDSGDTMVLVTKTIDFDDLEFKSQSGDVTSPDDPLIRVFSTPKDKYGIEMDIIQKVYISEINTDDESAKYYNIEYEFVNNHPDQEVEAKFMFHADTAYNNKDSVERYYIDGQKVEKTAVYTAGNGLVTDDKSAGTTPDSFSICNAQQSLAFTEKIVFDPANKPDLSIDYFHMNWDSNYFNNPSLGQNTVQPDGNGIDLGFALSWDLNSIGSAGGKSESVKFQYGIADVKKDSNMKDVPIEMDTSVTIEHSDRRNLWIQFSADDRKDGMNLTLRELNCKILDIENLDVTTVKNAADAIERIGKAKDIVSEHRGQLGAEQNRLEHTRNNIAVAKENLTQAESVIRDADIADEMAEYTKNNILIQSAQAMLAQSNQTPQGVLSLLK